jgi:hypothetical protein
METSSPWPSYQTGPQDSIFALGVASVNYANFERTVTWVFAAVSRLPEEYARMIHARVGTTACMTLIEQMLNRREWPHEPDDLVRHFLAASHVLIQSRNLLMHSVVVHSGDERANLYRTPR